MSLEARNFWFSVYQWSMALATLVFIISLITLQPVPAVAAWTVMVAWVYFYMPIYRKVKPRAHPV